MYNRLKENQEYILHPMLSQIETIRTSSTEKNLIKDVKKIQQALINKESIGDEFEEKMEAVHKLEEVADYLKDALGRGIEF